MYDLFYIDGTRIPPSGFCFDERGEPPHFAGKKSEALEKKLIWILDQICRALCFYRQGDFDEAISFFREARLIAPFGADLLTCLAITGHAIQDMDGALAHFRMAADLDHRMSQVWCNLGIHLYMRNLHRQALQYINRALRIDEAHSLSCFPEGRGKGTWKSRRCLPEL